MVGLKYASPGVKAEIKCNLIHESSSMLIDVKGAVFLWGCVFVFLCFCVAV